MNPARARAPLVISTCLVSQKDWALHFLAKHEMGENSTGRLGDVTVTLAGARSTAKMSRLEGRALVTCQLNFTLLDIT